MGKPLPTCLEPQWDGLSMLPLGQLQLQLAKAKTMQDLHDSRP
jgi:hypothetical protein